MKQYHIYKMDFGSDWMRRCGMSMGFSVFFLAAYYLGLHRFSDFTFGTLLLHFWLPLLLGVGFIVLTRVVKLNAPGIYAMIGAAFCLVYLLQAVTSGNGFRFILGLPGYFLCGAIYLVVLTGFFPSKMPACLVFLIAIVVRFILFDIGRLSIGGWIREGAVLFALAAFMLLPMGMISAKKKELS